MTKPRRVEKGQVWMVVRRAHERRGLLRPEPWLEELFRYALAVAQERTGVRVLAFEAMSNHFHLVVEDATGRLPDFMNELDELVARAANAEWGRRDALWERAGAKWTALLTPEAIEESVAYTILNCVEAGLVASARAWGGYVTLPGALGTEEVVTRPDLRFFTERTKMPETATLRISVPTTHEASGASAWQRRIAQRVERGEAEAVKRIGKGKFLGMEAVLAKPIDWKPSTSEELSSETPPAKAGAVPDGKSLLRGYRELRRAFLRAYAAAYEELRAVGTAVFPPGAWRWPRECGQTCADPPEAFSAAA